MNTNLGKILNKSKILKKSQLRYSRANLQRKGLWTEKLILYGFNWEYLCRIHTCRSDLYDLSDEFEKFSNKPYILLQTKDVRDKNDINHVKVFDVLRNLTPDNFLYTNMNTENVKFQYFVPSTSKFKGHRKGLSMDSSIYTLRKFFLNYITYIQFLGFFIGYLLPEMQKKHMTFLYRFFDSRTSKHDLYGSWYLTDLPQLLTSSLFITSLHDYYDWSNSSLSFSTNFFVSTEDDEEEDDEEEDDEEEDEEDEEGDQISTINHWNLIWNYFKII